MVSLFLSLVFASASVDIKQVRCSPYTSTGGRTFSARGPMDLNAKTAMLTISIDGEPKFQEQYELAATHNRGLYKMYFLENPSSTAPSIVLRISNGQLSPTSNLYLQSTETFSAVCDLMQ